jgi:2-polyprenyl-3-methyl-5-hydroxy-6-metoxy-1,4-benzoquinol methylase
LCSDDHKRKFFGMSQSVAYYNKHAQAFLDETLHVDMSALYDAFLPHLPENAHILDAGCGSGRDSREFLARGYRVTASDASEKLAGLASRAISHPVAVRTFDQVSEYQAYDGIWACASLLHLPPQHIPQALAKLWQALKPGGVLYMSFKRGEGQREHNGRNFTDATEEQLESWANALPWLEKITTWQTADRRPGRDEHWVNGVFHKSPKQAAKLITGGSHRLITKSP